MIANGNLFPMVIMVIGHEKHEVERKVVSILRILSESRDPLGARVIAARLSNYGVDLGERAVRYHLKIMDERGLTELMGRDGRLLTKAGNDEMRSALISDKVGFVINKIELLAFQTTLDLDTHSGQVPTNVSIFPKSQFRKACNAMSGAFKAGICVSDLVATANEGEKLAGLTVPEGSVGFATVCSIIMNGALLKAGIPMDSKFGGLLQIRRQKPLRFVELIEYAGSSLDPSEIFITSRMTSVREVIAEGHGNVLANFREIPAPCKATAEKVIEGLKMAGLGGLLMMGETSQSVCEIPVGVNKLGIILAGGLNPVAAALEAGIAVKNTAMSGVIDYQELTSFWQL
ncbi:MAG: NrpR regulatory domain-containing protein [Chloroflexota bacterium]